MKKYLLSALCALALSPLSAQTTYMGCDFATGIPKNFALYDEDQLEPSIDMKNIGFAIDTPWLVLAEEDGNSAAVSTSWYRKAGTSDDWMITSAFTVSSPQAILSWRAKAGNTDYRDGYSIYISETAATPTDFKKLSPVFTVKSEKAVWTEHELSLAEYAGKTVRVALVNNSRDCATLWIDDIFAGVPPALRITSTMERLMNTDGRITIAATISNSSTEDITGFTLSYDFGEGQTYDYKVNKTVPAGGELQIEFPSRAIIERNQTLHYTLSVSYGEDHSSTSGLITCFHRRIVAEEITGTWCGYCVRGIAAMKSMKELHPESFLGIAVHSSSETWEDPMDFSSYTIWLKEALGMPGYPHATVNRRKAQTGDPANIPQYYAQLLERDLTAGLQLQVTGVDKDARRVELHTDVYFLDDLDDNRHTLAYVLLENDVHKDAIIGNDGKPQAYNGYEQYNYYAGGAMGECGGFESLPEIVPGADMTYQDVARAFWGDGFNGLENSLPSAVKAAIPYGHDFTITLPENVLNPENTEVAVLLINSKTGEIINADIVPLRSFFSGIESLQATETGIHISRYAGSLLLSSPETITSVNLYGIDGCPVLSVSPATTEASLDISALKGIYILKASAGTTTITRKITF